MMNIVPCKLCGSVPVVKVRDYNVCIDYLTSYYVICSFCGNESRSYPSISEAINDWNDKNGLVKSCA